MIKKVVIAGCRDYNNYDEAKEFIDFCISEIRKTNEIVIVSGCASGADKIGEKYAEENGFTVEKYPADWKKYGRAAGPKRNKEMAEICDYVICFWDNKSKGTKSMIEYAKKIGKPVRLTRVEPITVSLAAFYCLARVYFCKATALLQISRFAFQKRQLRETLRPDE